MKAVDVDLAIREDLASALDPVVFARARGLEPDPWQAEVLRSPQRRVILNCCRQSGKSTTTAILALHTAQFLPSSLVLLLSPSLRQSSELFRKVTSLCRTTPGQVAPRAESALRLELGNGSRIVSLPGKEATVRGYSGVDLLVVDESARTPDELYLSVRPMLAVSGGRVVLLSTPFGRRGFFFDTWAAGGAEWLKIQVAAQDCPRIPAAFLEEERKVLGPRWFAQEYLCSFEEKETALFAVDSVRAAFREGVTRWEL